MGLSVTVSVMQVGIMRVLVHHRRVTMRVGVRLAGRVAGAMRVPVMFIVDMPVLVLHGGVGVLVLVALGEMQIEPDPHQRRRCEQAKRDRIAEHYDSRCAFAR